MTAIITLPRLGETMEEGRVVAWLVEEGAEFVRGDALVEVETDKTVVEVPALGAGRLIEWLVGEGDAVSVGADLARVSVAGADWAGGEAPDDAEKTDATTETLTPPDAQPLAVTAPSSRALDEPHRTAPEPQQQPRPRATPLARRLARQYGLPLAELEGTGRRGRIEREDVERARGAASDAPAAHPVTDFFLRSAGPVDGPPVVLLHGFAADSAIWAGVMARLARDGCRVLAPDLPAHGATKHDAKRPSDLSRGLAETLVAHAPGAPLHLVAHSMGALPALRLAAEAPAASLTLIAPIGLALGIDRAFIYGLSGASSVGEVAHLLERMVDGPLPLSAEAIAEIHASLSSGRLTALADALVGTSGQAVNLRATLAALAETLPVRLILGHRDRIIPWEDALSVSPKIAVHHIPCAGHMPQWDAAPEVVAIVRQAVGLEG